MSQGRALALPYWHAVQPALQLSSGHARLDTILGGGLSTDALTLITGAVAGFDDQDQCWVETTAQLPRANQNDLSAPLSTRLERHGVGTWSYLAPEQASGEEAGPRSAVNVIVSEAAAEWLVHDRRIRLLLIVIVVAFAGAFGRAVWLQGVRAGPLSKLAATQQRQTVDVPALTATDVTDVLAPTFNGYEQMATDDRDFLALRVPQRVNGVGVDARVDDAYEHRCLRVLVLPRLERI